MREFIRSDKEIRRQEQEYSHGITNQQLDVLRVVYFVNLQYRKYKTALRALSVLLTFEKNDEQALLATVFCYFSLKRYRKSANLLKVIRPKLSTKKSLRIYDYLESLILTESGRKNEARASYQRASSDLNIQVEYETLATLDDEPETSVQSHVN